MSDLAWGIAIGCCGLGYGIYRGLSDLADALHKLSDTKITIRRGDD